MTPSCRCLNTGVCWRRTYVPQEVYRLVLVHVFLVEVNLLGLLPKPGRAGAGAGTRRGRGPGFQVA